MLNKSAYLNKLAAITQQDSNRDSDHYATPINVIEELFKREKFNGVIHDPCCGDFRIMDVANRFGYEATGDDILLSGKSFFDVSHWSTNRHDNIVTNPPYSIAIDFLLHALAVSDTVAMLLPINFLAGVERFKEVHQIYRLASLYVFARRLNFGSSNPPPTDHAWFVYRHELPKKTIRYETILID